MPIGRRGPFTLQIGSTSKTDMAERAAEILTLTKMNWNSATFHMNDIVSFPFGLESRCLRAGVARRV
jgi:hypothetical protein